MKIRELENLLIRVLCSEIAEEKPSGEILSLLTSDTITALYALSKKHDLAHILASFIFRYDIEVDDSLANELENAQSLAIYRNRQIERAETQIGEILTDAKVAHIPMKGSILRPCYPAAYMRTSCDVDILVKESDLESALSAFQQQKYTLKSRNYHDVSLYSPSGVHLELHYNIQENMDNLDRVLSRAWDYSEIENGYRYNFTKEFFLFHIYSHTAYHFVAGGCGIRSLLDVWIMKHKMGLSLEASKELLETAQIYKFASILEELAEISFKGEIPCGVHADVLSYIFSGGVYGTTKNSVAARQSEKGGKFGYFMSRIFLPYRALKNYYPILEKHPWLLPFMQVRRWFRLMRPNSAKGAITEAKISLSVDRDEAESMKCLLESVGL